MNKKAHGFTIVELLITIVVIAILAAISVVAYNGIQQRAKNAARITTGEQWVRVFQLYVAHHGAMPPSVLSLGLDGKICLGNGFPTNANGIAQCQNYPTIEESISAIREADNAALMAELRAVTDLPTAQPIPTARRTMVGPYVQKTTAEVIDVVIVVDGTECGGGFRRLWTNNNTVSTCGKTVHF